MTTKELVEKVRAGSHRITPEGHVWRRIADGTWVSAARVRRDVVVRAQVELKFGRAGGAA